MVVTGIVLYVGPQQSCTIFFSVPSTCSAGAASVPIPVGPLRDESNDCQVQASNNSEILIGSVSIQGRIEKCARRASVNSYSFPQSYRIPSTLISFDALSTHGLLPSHVITASELFRPNLSSPAISNLAAQLQYSIFHFKN